MQEIGAQQTNPNKRKPRIPLTDNVTNTLGFHFHSITQTTAKINRPRQDTSRVDPPLRHKFAMGQLNMLPSAKKNTTAAISPTTNGRMPDNVQTTALLDWKASLKHDTKVEATKPGIAKTNVQRNAPRKLNC